MLAVVVTGITAFAEAESDGRWIAYPGDYGIWWGNRAQARRLKWCNRMSPTWPLYAPYPCVTFSKTVPVLDGPETVEIVADGSYTVGCSTTRVAEPGARLGKFTIPAGSNVTFHVRVYNDARPPAIRVKGRLFASDVTWRAGWNRFDDVAVETVEGEGDTPPGLVKFPVKPMEPVKTWRDDKGRLFADFGRETYGYLKLRDVRGKGALKIVYAESLAEAKAEEFDTKDDYKTVLDGWELLAVDTEGKTEREIRREHPTGFRYICVRQWEGGDVTVGSVAMDVFAEFHFVFDDGFDAVNVPFGDLRVFVIRREFSRGRNIRSEVGFPVIKRVENEWLRVGEHVSSDHETGVKLRSEEIGQRRQNVKARRRC